MVRKLTIREARPGDVDAIQRLARESWHAAYDDLLGPERVDSAVDRAYASNGLREDVTDSGAVFLVAATEELVGFAHAQPHEDIEDGGEGEDGENGGESEDSGEGEEGVARLARLYVAPDRWDEGIGGTLLARAEYLLDEQGFERLCLEAFAANDVGVSFYESSGFERVAEREFESDGEDYGEYVYEKPL
jgi:GNAT superfamily N-acetyltransferase